jgi:hypothetical protein
MQVSCMTAKLLASRGIHHYILSIQGTLRGVGVQENTRPAGQK